MSIFVGNGVCALCRAHISHTYWGEMVSLVWFGSQLARDMDKTEECVPLTRHVCFYHNFQFYLCCELCGSDGGGSSVMISVLFLDCENTQQKISAYWIGHIQFTFYNVALLKSNPIIVAFGIFIFFNHSCICCIRIDFETNWTQTPTHRKIGYIDFYLDIKMTIFLWFAVPRQLLRYLGLDLLKAVIFSAALFETWHSHFESGLFDIQSNHSITPLWLDWPKWIRDSISGVFVPFDAACSDTQSVWTLISYGGV